MSDQPSFTVVFACGEGATPSVGESGNDFSAYRVIAIANGDYTERLNDAENQLAECRAENERLENLLASDVHSCSPLCKRPLCVLRRRVRELELTHRYEQLAELEKKVDKYMRFNLHCIALTGTLWPQNETTEKLAELIAALGGEDE